MSKSPESRSKAASRSAKPAPEAMSSARTVDLTKLCNWPVAALDGAKGERLRKAGRAPAWVAAAPASHWDWIRKQTAGYSTGQQTPWGIPFAMAAKSPRVILAARDADPVTIPLRGTATHLCLLHYWYQIGETAQPQDPREGLVVGEYVIAYADGTEHVQPVRARFEVAMSGYESPGPPWLAVSFYMPEADAADRLPGDVPWGRLQTGIGSGSNSNGYNGAAPMLYALPNPHPGRALKSLTVRGLSESALVVAGLTLYSGTAHPLSHLPRRAYRVKTAAGRARVDVVEASVDLGVVAYVEKASAPRDAKWLAQPGVSEPVHQGGSILHLTGAPDATVRVQFEQEGKRLTRAFHLGEAFQRGRSAVGDATLECLARARQWLRVRVIDDATGQPTPVRIHFSGPRGNYIAPYGHHEQINCNWFEDYGADTSWGGRSYAYVSGDFTTDLPVGDLYVEVLKGFEYTPLRQKVRIARGQTDLELRIDRWTDLRKAGWITADTHVHFISPHTAWLEGQAEGINVVNLLASQWGRLFTSVGDVIGKPNVVENDTIVYVGTENRNHMLGHISMLGTQGALPVYPMCCGGVTEAWLGDPDLRLLADWARENRAKGGVVIRPHFPYCGHTEDPLPIMQGLIDALEIWPSSDFPMQEWYRYLNCGYRVAVCGGTDKMSASMVLGWMRTYAKLDPGREFTYDAWGDAVRAGRTVTTTGPLLDLTVDGHGIGEAITMNASGGTVEVHAWTESFHPLGVLEIVQNGRVVASAEAKGGARSAAGAQSGAGARPSAGARRLEIRERVSVEKSGWIAARCRGLQSHVEGKRSAAHTSPVYLQVGDTRAFDGPAAEHMLGLVSGGLEYLETIATAYDAPTRRRMVSELRQAQNDLKCRLVVEGGYHLHEQTDRRTDHG